MGLRRWLVAAKHLSKLIAFLNYQSKQLGWMHMI
jgi:hypothetical protein